MKEPEVKSNSHSSDFGWVNPNFNLQVEIRRLNISSWLLSMSGVLKITLWCFVTICYCPSQKTIEKLWYFSISYQFGGKLNCNLEIKNLHLKFHGYLVLCNTWVWLVVPWTIAAEFLIGRCIGKGMFSLT